MSVHSAYELLEIPEVSGSVKHGFLWLASHILAHEASVWQVEPLRSKKSWKPLDGSAFSSPLAITAHYKSKGYTGGFTQVEFSLGGEEAMSICIPARANPEDFQNSLDEYMLQGFADSYFSHQHDACIPEADIPKTQTYLSWVTPKE